MSEVEECSTPGCDGDARYAAPGRGHDEDCHYPQPPPRGTTMNDRMSDMDALVEKAALIADEHWITNHNGPRCVGCGWWEPDDGEDVSRAARRHVAEAILEAVLLTRFRVYTELRAALDASETP